MTDATPAVAARPGALARSWQRSRAIDPRYLIAGLITLVLLVAQFRYHMVGGYERLLLSLLVCTATEALLSWFDRGKVVNLQVTDVTAQVLEVRCLVSARSAPRTFDLRCEVREKMMAFLRDEIPEALPRQRLGLVETQPVTA